MSDVRSECGQEFSRKLFAGACAFVAGAADPEALPEFPLPEIAFLGRSNVGKSTLINALLNRTGLARVSRTPGRTRQINLFRVADALMLADLPGYGFAKVSKTESQAWNSSVREYLVTRKNLRQAMLLTDARRGIMDSDMQAMDLLDSAAVAYRIVLTKSDALSATELSSLRDAAAAVAAGRPAANPEVFMTSAKSGGGIPELRLALAELAVRQ